jgi:hypothetical protein
MYDQSYNQSLITTMRITFHYLFAVGACVLLTSCSTVHVQKEVACSFYELKEAGKLPGFAPTEHGRLQTQGFPLNHRITYPASVIVYATKDQDPARYTYTFTKESNSSDWRLTAAWRTLPDGQREELKIE